ncbi:adenylyl cyclase CyaB, putative [Archaeoglobus sulfaticallidus PM70-1]|uniref:Adenylyl cyclase CyaB, putative n=1 Tax=Archaeoglobus sulfaticallidus PM70-1 TaxID=387631 RepID=N0BFS1_9EURY|nr:class IV adenylate cyclase [Archaeoglobus sulfaticallidus]AGK61127.1 adenylyl cyclase CyaB, putative [Archaeoglobus sulfaticallidus PM70-1]
MIEIEAKFMIDDSEFSRIDNLLSEIAELVIEKEEVDIYYKHPLRDFAKTDEAFRIRKDVEGVTITYKGKKMDPETKTREEIKVRIYGDDYDNARDMFRKLGFEEFATVRKIRKIYRMDNAIICLDTLDFGKFIEIEVDTQDIEEGKRKISEIAKKINLSGKNIRKSYLELMLGDSA